MRFLQNQGCRKDGKLDEKTMQKGGCQKVGKSMAKGSPKVIVDAERHRRTPWTLAVESKAIESKKSADIGGTGAEKREKTHAKTTKVPPRWLQKSIQNQ